MKVAIIGYGIEGQIAAKYWAKKGATITVCDSNIELKVPDNYTARLGETYLSSLGTMDLIVRSPGIRPDAILAANPLFPGLAKRITSSIREFMAECPAPVIGITGTKGKGTTSTLIARILEVAGKTVWLGGNIGRSPLEFLPDIKPADLVVLELSSFQLMDIEQSPHVAVCLMIAPEHLNWHTDMNEYVAAKSNLFRYQTEADLAVFKAGDKYFQQIASTSPGRKLAYDAHLSSSGLIRGSDSPVEPENDNSGVGAYIAGGQITIDGQVICKTSEVGLIGPHNLENICAAITATWELVGKKPEPIRTAVSSFMGLEHRLELVGEVNGVSYYDDSFATTPETAIAAIKAFAKPKVMILGGSDKGASYDELARVVEDGDVIHTILIGDTAPQIEQALRVAGFTHLSSGLTDMAKIVETASHITQPGDIVLLSPACASFGLFSNYKDRGDQFKAAVKALAKPKAAA